jgi:hypothetical protein
MAQFFTYELRQPPLGRGWSAYPNAGSSFEVENYRIVNDIFSHTILLDHIPEYIPWEGVIPLATGQWMLLWRHPAQPRVSGTLLSSKEWSHYESDITRVIREPDPSFVSTFFPENQLQAWPENITSEFPGVPLGSNCAGYLGYAESFRHMLTNSDRTGFVSAWNEGTQLPTRVSQCPFVVTASGPQTPDELSATLQAWANKLTPESSHSPQPTQSHGLIVEENQHDSRPENPKGLISDQDTPKSQHAFYVLALSATLAAAIAGACYSFIEGRQTERARNEARNSQKAADDARKEALAAQKAAEAARDKAQAALSAIESRSTPESSKESTGKSDKKTNGVRGENARKRSIRR